METNNKKPLQSGRKGTTFVELLLYVSIFLILTPILLTSSINSVRLKQQHIVEKNINADSQFIMERIYDLIGSSKRVDVGNSILGIANGKLSLVMQDDSLVTIEFNDETDRVEITEGGVTSAISSQDAIIHQLYFSKIPDNLNDPSIILGLNINLKISGIDEFEITHDYIVSANLELGDYDEDGSPDYVDMFPKELACSGDADNDGVCDEVDNCIIFSNPFQTDTDADSIGDECDSSSFEEEGGGGEGGGEECVLEEGEDETDFSIFNGVVTPQENFRVTATVVGAAIKSGSLDLPVTTSIKIGNGVYQLWGDISKALDGNVNDGENPRNVVIDEEFEAGTDISVRGQSWMKYSGKSGSKNSHWYVYLSKDSISNSPNIKVLRRNDNVPNVPGLSGQGSIGQYLAPYVSNGKIIIGENDVIFLFELGTNNLSSSAADFQDLVILLTIDSTAPQCINEGNLAITAYNCSAEDDLLELIYRDPPPPGNQLGGTLLAASPLSPSVLQALIDTYPENISTNVFRHVMYQNTKLPTEIMTSIQNMSSLDSGSKWLISSSNDDAETYAWEEFNRADLIEYNATYQSDAPQGENWKNRIVFSNPNPAPNPAPGEKGVDLFKLTVPTGSESVIVKTVSNGVQSSPVTLSDANDEATNNQNFLIQFSKQSTSSYFITISSENNSNLLTGAIFDFGAGANISSPPEGVSQNVHHFVAYCSGGCSTSCGDVGVGVAIENNITDKCYMDDSSPPEWCLKWLTTANDDSENPAYVGGTQIGEASAWWEKDFTSILNDIQKLNLQSITIETQLAYQNTNGFFCDTLNSDCPISGSLVGAQDVQLFNWSVNDWETIGQLDISASISDQQIVEVMYQGTDADKFIHPTTNVIRARMNFKWNGVGEVSAPAFMVIDYFTAHLKW